MLEIAIKIAVKAHSGQLDKAAKPYVLNLIEVEYQNPKNRKYFIVPEITKVILS